MAWRKISAAYLEHAQSLADNPEQQAAYDSKGHCVVLAGPGSGKTKTLTLKLARILAEDVRAPRGVACITYSQQCARELSRRLETLHLRESSRLFVGTVHGFCLRHLLLPYAELAKLPLPFPLKMASDTEAKAIEKAVGERLFGLKHVHKSVDMGKHRRSVFDREGEIWKSKPELARWALQVEAGLRARGLIDYDDLIIQGRALVRHNDWVLQLVQSKFPALIIDEYQDLGVALHEIVQRLAFDGGVRLFAVGDYDQTVYGFNGADGTLLQQLADRPDVEMVRLRLNYRSGTRIIRASEFALGEKRNYRPSDPKRNATIDFVLRPGGLADQASHAINSIVPAALGAKLGRKPGDIAILYKDSSGGDIAAHAATSAGRPFVRADNAAPYKKVALTSWIEDCSAWCAGGWRRADPKLEGLIDRWGRFYARSISEQGRRDNAIALTDFLWNQRSTTDAADFVGALKAHLLDELLACQPSLGDQAPEVSKLAQALKAGGALAGFTTSELGRQDGSPDHLNLLTFHSSKGSEFDVVIMLGLDQGALPWRNASPGQLADDRRVFYVGLTRARNAVHLLYSGWTQTPWGARAFGRSMFVDELQTKLIDAELAEARRQQ